MKLRQRYWVDRQVQGALVSRVVLYWAGGVLAFAIGLGYTTLFSDANVPLIDRVFAFLTEFCLWLPGLILLLPLIAFDIVRVSCHFAGPIYRLRQHLRTMIDNPKCQPIHFRKEDYWHDLADSVNALHNKLCELQQRVEELEAHSVAPDEPPDNFSHEAEKPDMANADAEVTT